MSIPAASPTSSPAGPAPTCSPTGSATTGGGTSSPPGSASGACTATSRRRLDAATDAFLRRTADGEPEAACRQLFFDLLWPLATEEAKAGLIEQSCDVVAEAGPLACSSPRHGSSTSSATAATSPPRGSGRRAGSPIRGRWIRASNGGRRGSAGSRTASGSPAATASTRSASTTSSPGNRRKQHLPEAPPVRRASRNEDAMLGYFTRRVRVRNAHAERWRADVPVRQHAEVDAAYEEILDRLRPTASAASRCCAGSRERRGA